jgi:hypothetical protein
MGDPGEGFRFPAEIFLLIMLSRQAMGSTEPPIKWAPEIFPSGYSGRDVTQRKVPPSSYPNTPWRPTAL